MEMKVQLKMTSTFHLDLDVSFPQAFGRWAVQTQSIPNDFRSQLLSGSACAFHDLKLRTGPLFLDLPCVAPSRNVNLLV